MKSGANRHSLSTHQQTRHVRDSCPQSLSAQPTSAQKVQRREFRASVTRRLQETRVPRLRQKQNRTKTTT